MIFSTIWKYLAEGFLLGLTLGTTCAATCGPMYMPYLMQREQSVGKSIINILEISAGRFVSYVSFGIMAGVLGSSINIILDRGWFVSVAYILFSILLLIETFRTHQKHKGCSVSKWSKFADRPILFGMLTGISLCPSFFGAMTAAFGAGGVVGGGSIFAGFFFGSSIFLMPFMIAGLAGNIKLFQKAAVIASVVVAAYFIGKGGMGLYEQYHKSNSRGGTYTSTDIVNALDSLPLIIIDTSASSLVLRDTLSLVRKGVTSIQADTNNLPVNCNILVGADYLDNPKKLRIKDRFVIILPRDTVLSSENYASEIRLYLKKYMFKKDTINGTLFDMASFLDNSSHKHKDK